MCYQRNSRGSVLLLVVALLTIIGLLGASLLFMSQADARTSKALMDKAQADPIADGILTQILTTLKRDLYFDNDQEKYPGPYGAPRLLGQTRPWGSSPGWSKVGMWKAWIDAPREADTTADPVDNYLADNWLASPTPAAPPQNGSVKRIRFYRISDLTGELGSDASDVRLEGRPDAQGILRWTSYPNPKPAVDTDRDGWADSLLFNTFVKNGQDKEYWAAVRIVDLGGLICANTASNPNDSGVTDRPETTRPVSVDLQGFLENASLYQGLNDARCRETISKDLKKFSEEFAEHLLKPDDSKYSAFAIGDELFLRCLGGSALTRTGRLYDAVPTLTTDLRRFLATYNVSRSVVRHPYVSPTDSSKRFTTYTGLPAIEKEEDLQEIYENMLRFLNVSVANPDERKRMAAAFTANVWAYQDPAPPNSMASQEPWPFAPAGETFTAFGLTPGLVITEAYVKAQYDGSEYIEVQAIELYNYSITPIDLSQYEIQIKDGKSFDLPEARIDPGAKLVLYRAQGDPDDISFTPPTNSEELDSGTLDLRNEIMLIKKIKGYRVPIDYVPDMGYEELTPPQPPNVVTQVEIDFRRDDDEDRCRYLVGDAYVREEKGTFGEIEHKLGISNELTPADVEDRAEYPVVIWRERASVRDIGELGRIFLCGPLRETAVELIPFTRRIQVFDLGSLARGRLDFHPESVNNGGYRAVRDQQLPIDMQWYPDVPPATLLNEFFSLVPTDDTRTDQPVGERTRIYGRVNINTAPAEVLRRLPWPERIRLSSDQWIDLRNNPGNSQEDEIGALIDVILAYREKRTVFRSLKIGTNSVPIVRNYANRTHPQGSGIRDLRGDSNFPGFLTPGEIAIPLADFYSSLCRWSNYTLEPPTDVKEKYWYTVQRDELYRAISNLITVNSDVFAAHILVQLGDNASDPDHTWRFLAVIDRSCCRHPSHEPAVLMFTQVP